MANSKKSEKQEELYARIEWGRNKKRAALQPATTPTVPNLKKRDPPPHHVAYEAAYKRATANSTTTLPP
jgi:hypothetical protein